MSTSKIVNMVVVFLKKKKISTGKGEHSGKMYRVVPQTCKGIV